MTNKAFYQLAADEVAKGNIDQALWIKVVADMSTATKIQQQAMYIQLRAGELAVQSATTKVADSVPVIKRVLKWVVGLVVVGFVITLFFAMAIARKDDQESQRIALADASVVENHLATHELDTKYWTAAGFTDTEFRCDDETGGGAWQREEHSAASSSVRRCGWSRNGA